MNRFDKVTVAASAAVLVLSLAACQAQAGKSPDPTEPIVQATQAASVTEVAAETTPMQFWDDVVELVSPAGESTTVYLLADGRYLDRQDRFFTFDGLESWTSEDGTVWSRKPDSNLASTNVSAEFAVERLLAQRPDHLFFSDAEGSSTASKIVLTFDTPVTNFRFLKLEGTMDKNGDFACTDTQELFFQDVIMDSDLMVLETELEGIVPTRGISFTDASGNTQYYYLALSGEDNVPLLVHFG